MADGIRAQGSGPPRPPSRPSAMMAPKTVPVSAEKMSPAIPSTVGKIAEIPKPITTIRRDHRGQAMTRQRDDDARQNHGCGEPDRAQVSQPAQPQNSGPDGQLRVPTPQT